MRRRSSNGPAGYGIPYVAVDGNDVVATASAMEDVVRCRARRARAPPSSRRRPIAGTATTRAIPSATGLRTRCEEWRARDPLLVHERRLREAGVGDDEIKALEASIAEELDGAVEAARRLADPAAATLTDFVVRPRPARAEPAPPGDDAPVFRTMDADPRRRSRSSSPRTIVCSSPAIDVGAGGNVFGLTRGLADRFGGRVRDTPISETAIIGLGVGAAMAGMRPVVELMYLDFLGVCFDQLLNQAAKLPFMTGGAAEMALTVRTQFGAGRSSGSQHSQSLEALLAHIPGLTVVMPSTPADTYGLLRASIQDPNPVVFIENRLLYGMKGPQPPPDYVLPIGKAAVVRAGNRPDRRVGLADGARGDGRRRACGGRGDLRRGDRPQDRRLRSTWRRSSSRCTRRAGCSSRTRRWCPSASARKSRPPSPARASGISTRRSSGSGPRRLRRPMRPTSNEPGFLTATTSRTPFAGSVAV